MKVSRGKVAEHRAAIVKAAAHLFRERGFDHVSVADVMKAAGLTHGGFYGHFFSKKELTAEACDEALKQHKGTWPELPLEASDRSLGAIAAAYLTTYHRDNPGRGCLFAALGSEVRRQPKTVRKRVNDGLQAHLTKLAGLLTMRDVTRRREEAVAAMAAFVGAMVLSRAVSDAAFSEEILRSTAKTFGRRQMTGP